MAIIVKGCRQRQEETAGSLSAFHWGLSQLVQNLQSLESEGVNKEPQEGRAFYVSTGEAVNTDQDLNPVLPCGRAFAYKLDNRFSQETV